MHFHLHCATLYTNHVGGSFIESIKWESISFSSCVHSPVNWNEAIYDTLPDSSFCCVFSGKT